MNRDNLMGENDKITLCLPAKHLYLSMVGASIEALIKRLRGSERVIYDIQIALQEICANVVDHAYRDQAIGNLTVETFMIGSELIIHVIDEGQPFNPDQTKPPALGQLQERGYGLFFAKKLMDEVRYERLEGHNRWTLRKTLSLSLESQPF